MAPEDEEEAWFQMSEDKRTGYDYWIGSAHHLYGKNTGKYYEIAPKS